MGSEVIERVSIVSSVDDREKEQSVRRSLQHVLSLMESAHVHIAHLDASGKYLGWDLVSQRMFGYCEGEVIGRMHIATLFALVEDFDRVWRIVRDHRKFRGDIAFRDNAGIVVVVRLSMIRECSEDGTVTGYTVYAVDRSDERELEHVLESHLIMLADSN